jgi:hypothetical protein
LEAVDGRRVQRRKRLDNDVERIMYWGRLASSPPNIIDVEVQLPSGQPAGRSGETDGFVAQRPYALVPK